MFVAYVSLLRCVHFRMGDSRESMLESLQNYGHEFNGIVGNIRMHADWIKDSFVEVNFKGRFSIGKSPI